MGDSVKRLLITSAALALALHGSGARAQSSGLWPGVDDAPVAALDPAARRDRWGRPVLFDDQALARALDALGKGQAVIAPTPGAVERAAWRAAEEEARREGLGLWGEGGVARAAERAHERLGAFAVVAGVVTDVAETRVFTYLNFGEDWRTDFTVRVERARARRWKREGFDLSALEGRAITVRGFLFEANGPMIEALSPLQFEVEP